MIHHQAEDESPPTTSESILDHRSLRDQEGIPFHEHTDTVPQEVVEQMSDLADLAGAGITNPDGELLLRRLTDTCSWKIPVATVGPEEDFATAITEHIEETIGFTVTLDTIEGVWDITVQTEDEENTASRAFVIFSASPVSGSYDLDAAMPGGESVEGADWFGELPDEIDTIPGTNLFVE